MSASHRVSAPALNLRREPKTSGSNRIATLPQGTPVEKLADVSGGWVQVRVVLSGVLREGFVSAQHLALVPKGTSFAVEALALDLLLPPARLPEARAESARAEESLRVYPLGESGRPEVKGPETETLVKQLLELINWLDCEAEDHKSYKAKAGGNRAATYVCDYCNLAGIYLPQVWWTPGAIAELAQDRKVGVELGRTVRELSANGLSDWLEDHGTAFGWHREIEPILLQEAANAGEVCLIVVKSEDLSLPGHIAAVMPEHPGCEAKRNKQGDVTRPVESYCAKKNDRAAQVRSAWWLAQRYQGYAFWGHPLGKAT